MGAQLGSTDVSNEGVILDSNNCEPLGSTLGFDDGETLGTYEGIVLGSFVGSFCGCNEGTPAG